MLTVVRYCVIWSPSTSQLIEMTSAPVIPRSDFAASVTATCAASANPTGELPITVTTFATWDMVLLSSWTDGPGAPSPLSLAPYRVASPCGARPRPCAPLWLARLHWEAVFDTLSDKLQSALGDLRGRGRLDEEAISRAMREIRLALLEADVNLKVVREFVAAVKESVVDWA